MERLTDELDAHESNSTTGTPEKKCPGCGSFRISIIRMPSYHPHYAALKCGECDQFLIWQQKPETEGKRRDIAIRIDKTRTNLDRLTQWEQEFIGNLARQKKLSPRQMEVLANIESRLGGAAS